MTVSDVVLRFPRRRRNANKIIYTSQIKQKHPHLFFFHKEVVQTSRLIYHQSGSNNTSRRFYAKWEEMFAGRQTDGETGILLSGFSFIILLETIKAKISGYSEQCTDNPLILYIARWFRQLLRNFYHGTNNFFEKKKKKIKK